MRNPAATGARRREAVTRVLGLGFLEYAVLSLTNKDYTIEPWTPVDSIAWLKAMAWDLRGNMQDH